MKTRIWSILWWCMAVATVSPAAEKPVYKPEDLAAKGEVPVPRVRVPPTYPLEMRQAGKNGEVEVEFVINPDGRVTKAQVLRSTNPAFAAPALAAIGKWVFKPGRLNGKAVNVLVRQVLIFDTEDTPSAHAVPVPAPPPTAPSRADAPSPPEIVLDYVTPMLRDWVQPAYPAAAAKAKSEGRVLVEFVVEADGSVSREKVKKSGGAEFDEAALAAVRQWKFKPGVDEKKPAAMAMVVPVVFEPAQLSQKQTPLYPQQHLMPRLMETEPAHDVTGMDPPYPFELEERKLPGRVKVEFMVDETGQARAPKVLYASHPAFVESTLRMLERLKFEPARQGPLPKASKMECPVEFYSMDAKPADILRANHLEILGEPPSVLPQPLMLIEPVYPRDRLLAGEGGSAELEFSVNAEGRPGLLTVTAASAPEFGAALKSAVESWAFSPAQSREGPAEVKLKVVHAFAPADSPAGSRLAALLQPGAAGVGGPAGLDQKLKPLWRGYPVYPSEFKERQLAGEAEIEFIIDRDGRARLPRIVKANEEAFGWAAATAISQWVFERPTRAGEPVDVTVRIPVGFKPPKAE